MNSHTKRETKKLTARFCNIMSDFKGHKDFINVLLDIMEMHNNKSNDYASRENPFSNVELCERGGFEAWKGVIIRLGDKYSRLLNALRGRLFKYEGIEDAFLDNASYSIIGLIEYRKINKELNKNETKKKNKK